MKPTARLRSVLLIASSSLLVVLSASAQTTYTWANSNVSGTPAANLDWFTGGSNTQGTWTGGTPVSANNNTIQIFEGNAAGNALTNTATPSTQTMHLNNGGTAFQLGTLTLTGRASSTVNANLTMSLQGDALHFSAATGTVNLSAINATRTITYNVANNIQLGTASTATALTMGVTSAVTTAYDFSGSITQQVGAPASSLTKSGTSTLTLSNSNNSYTGATTISGGTLVVSKLSNGLSNSSIGASSNAATNLRLQGTALRYVGTGDSTDRLFQITGSNVTGITVTLDASGTGALKFTNTGTFTNANPSQPRTLKLTGNSTHDNTLAYSMTNNGSGVTSLIKDGTGTWVLTGNNAAVGGYTGTTQIDNGILVFSRTAAKASGTATAAAAGSVGLGVGGEGYYSAANVGDLFNSNSLTGFSLNASSGVAIDTTNATGGSFDQNVALTASRALTKLGTSTLILSQTNTYSGNTTVSNGTLLINGNQSTATGAVSVAAAATLGGNGTVGGATVLAGTSIHAPGSSAATVGKQTFSSSVTYDSGSIFEWNLASTPAETGRGTSYDAVNAASLGVTTGAIFRVVLDGAQDFTDTFWDTSRTWSDIFKTGDAGSNLSIASIFTGTIQYYNVTNGALGAPTGQGNFTFSGSDLTWTPNLVPEPTSALAGLLLGAGLLRRRRHVGC